MNEDINNYEENFIKDYENRDFERTMAVYRKKKVLELLNNYTTDYVLEIGCGMEPLFLVYTRYKKMCVVEAGRKLADHADKLRAGRNNIEIVHGYVEDQVSYLKRQNYDFILIEGILHEAVNPEVIMDAVYDLSGDSTKILVSTPNPQSFHLTLAYESGIVPRLGMLTERARRFQRNRVFTMEDLKQFVQEHGFKILKEGSYFIKPFSHEQMRQMLDLAIIDEKTLEGLYRMVRFMPHLGAENYVIISK